MIDTAVPVPTPKLSWTDIHGSESWNELGPCPNVLSWICMLRVQFTLYNSHARPGCSARPAFSAPSLKRGARFPARLRAHRAVRRRSRIYPSHSGMVRRIRPRMRNCASGNLEIQVRNCAP